MLFDTHCHYNLAPLKERWTEHWKVAQEHDVAGAVVVGTNRETSILATAIAEQEPRLFCSVGTHPNEYHAVVKNWLESSWNDDEQLESIVSQDVGESRKLATTASEVVVAIGEIGLDYYRLPKDSKERTLTMALQQEACSAYITLAGELELPLIIHVRDSGETAYFDLLEILKQTISQQQRFVLHCLSGPPAYLKEALRLGAFVGLAGNSTYANSSALRELVSLVPKNKILLETDAPFLPPEGFRGSLCEPWMIAQTAEYLRHTLGIELAQCYENALEFYNLELPQ